MIVLDASAALELLLRTPAAAAVEARLFEPGETLHAPELVDLEVAQVLRRYALADLMTAERATEALEIWRVMPVRRWPHAPLMTRVWSLRAALTAYDAAYVALAEALDAVLVTRDARIARTSAVRARVELV